MLTTVALEKSDRNVESSEQGSTKLGSTATPYPFYVKHTTA